MVAAANRYLLPPVFRGPHRTASTAPWVGLSAFLLACGGSPHPGHDYDLDALPRLHLEEQLRIGSLDDPDAGFSQIGVVDVDREGRVYVAEAQALHIRVYDTAGRELNRFGRRGEGPGEFQLPPHFGIRGDTLWVLTGMPRRAELFTLDGGLMSSHPVEGVPVRLWASPDPTLVGLVLPGRMRGDGLFVGTMTARVGGLVAPRPPDDEPPSDTDTLYSPVVRFTVTGEVVDTIDWYPHPPPANRADRWVQFGSDRYRIPDPPSSDPLLINVDDGRIHVDRAAASSAAAATFRVTRVDFAGDTVYSRDFGYRPVRYSPSGLDSVAWRSVRMPRGLLLTPRPPLPADSVARFRAIRRELAFPEFQPPVQGHWLDSDGRLWLRREDVNGPAIRWLVLDPDGQPLGKASLPRGNRIAWSGGDTAWIVEPDELDVPWLVRYRIAGLVR